MLLLLRAKQILVYACLAGLLTNRNAPYNITIYSPYSILLHLAL